MLLDGLLVGHEDAERVAVEVFVHAQRFIRIVGAIEPQAPSERQHALVHDLQFIRVADSQIEMELLRYRRVRPCRPPDQCQGPDAPGVIGYVDGVPAGWCSFGPRSEMARLVRSRTIPSIDDVPVWSIVCFVVKPPHRRQGLCRGMLDAAVAYAREHGVRVLEAYPVDRQRRRISATAASVGTTDLFEAAALCGCRPRWPAVAGCRAGSSGATCRTDQPGDSAQNDSTQVHVRPTAREMRLHGQPLGPGQVDRRYHS